MVELVDINGQPGTSGGGIIFGGYEERSYCISSPSDGLSMINTSLHVCSSQHHSILVRPTVCISIYSLISRSVILLSQASLCSSTSSCSRRDCHNLLDDGRASSVIANLICCCLIECKIVSLALRWAFWKCCWSRGDI